MSDGLAHSSGQGAASIPGELVERLEAASVGSRELDAEIWQALVECDRLWRHWVPVDEHHGHGQPQPGALYYAPHCAQVFVTPHLTTSLDAALALAERTITRRGPIDLSICGSAQVVIHHSDPCGSPLATAFGQTPALALCIAILKATTAAQTGDNGHVG